MANQYPVYFAGQRLTATLLSSGLPLIARKNADEGLNNNITVQPDDDLFVSVAAGASYIVEGWLIYSAASNTPDLRINYTYPSGATFTRTDWGAPPASTSTNDVVEMSVATTADVGRAAGTTQRSVLIRGDLVVGGTAGTFRVTWAQVTSDANTLSMKTGSHIKLTRYA